MRCPHCGKQVSDKAIFCKFCGGRIDDKVVLNKTAGESIDSVEQVQEERGAVSKEYSTIENHQESAIIHSDKERLPKRMTAIIAVAVAVAVLVAIVGVVMYFGTSNSPKDKTGTIEKKNEESQTSNKRVGEISDTKGIVISSSDWDWEISNPDNSEDPYVVDAIFWVRNDSKNVIVGIEYNVYTKKGEYLENAQEPGATRFAYGYIAPGDSGVMIGKAWTYKKVASSNLDPRVVSAYINNTISDYVIPSGKIIDYTKANDSYDVSINNDNSIPVNSNAKLVMVLEKNGTIQGADATGSLDTSIPGNTRNFVQEDAFVDPGLHGEFGGMSVYAIDFYSYGIDGRYYDNNEWDI